ncbi:MAG: ABC transporter ATP-binding protein [Solirubrobacteraceae bacterium]|nr:ABC transporter ATP-binding protein [Solirubrobacteraceae bacterium]
MTALRSHLRRWFVPVADGQQIVGAAPPVAVWRMLRLFWPDVKPFRGRIAIGLLFLAAVPALETVEIWLFGHVVDDVLVPGDIAALLPIALIYLGLAVAGGIAGFGDAYYATWVGEHFVLRLRTRVYAHVQTLSPAALDRRRLGDVLTRLTGDIQAIESFVLAGIGEGISAILRILFFGTALFVLDWQLALASLVVAPLFFVAARGFVGLVRGAAREKRRRSGSLGAVAEEALGQAALVQSLGAEERERERFVREGERIVEAELAATRIRATFAPITDLIRLAGVLAVLALGVWAIQRGDLTLGGLLVFMTYLSQLYGPIRDLSSLSTTIFQAAAAAERVVELLDEEPTVRDREGARPLRRVRGHVELRGVSFRHPGADRDALSDVSLVVRPGETVAIIGESGAGKSTLASLLLRFADPSAGSLHLDGHDLRDVTMASVRENVGLLLQDAPVPDAPLRDVISAGRPDASDEEIEAAARAAGIHDVIAAMPDGYATRAGQRGRGMSGGQRQRVALARTLLRDAPVLVLDEPTTGLDAASKAALLEPLQAAARTRTTLLISHDPDVIACADRVIELRDGKLVAPPTGGAERHIGVALATTIGRSA